MSKYKKLPFRQSPNYTPASQTQAIYGRPRRITFGAGHWWNDPSTNPSFSGVVSTLMNAARQASANAIVGDGVVQEIVRDKDTSWATNQANPYTYSIEVDPQIVYMWRKGSKSQVAKAKRIYDTLCEYIADKGYHNLTWYPHKHWFATACNPINWGSVMSGAKKVYAAKHKPTPPKPSSKPVPAAKRLPEGHLKYKANADNTKIWDLTTNPNYKAVTSLKKGATFDAVAYIDFNGTRYLVTQYSFENGKKVGVNIKDVELVTKTVIVPEWQKNLKDVPDQKLYVLPLQTPVVDLNTLKVIKQLGQKTAIDVAKMTTVKGVEYLLSSYSVTNVMPNGIKRADLGVPVEPPKAEKPLWLAKWQDITDVVMYTRSDTDLVNFADGKTVKKIARATPIDVSSTTEYLGRPFAITKYSTDKKIWQGIAIADLDMKPVVNLDVLPAAPVQPTLDERVGILEKALDAVLKFLKIK